MPTQELVRKGVPKADIEGGLREVFGDEATAQQQLRGGAHPEERLEGAAEEEQSALPMLCLMLVLFCDRRGLQSCCSRDGSGTGLTASSFPEIARLHAYGRVPAPMHKLISVMILTRSHVLCRL